MKGMQTSGDFSIIHQRMHSKVCVTSVLLIVCHVLIAFLIIQRMIPITVENRVHKTTMDF